jgi:hypothetical protein
VDSIISYADALPTSGVTISALRALDWVAPGQWENTVGFDNMLQAYTGESDWSLLEQVKARAVELFDDTSQGYQRGLWIYQAVDSTDKKLGLAAAGHMLGERFSLLKFIAKLTPSEETTQTVDLTVKIVAELAAFCYINGLPGDSIGDFVAALNAYEKENQIRMAALVCFDGMLPLGDGFLDKVSGTLNNLTPTALEGNQTFQAIRSMIPGGDTLGQLGFMGQTFGAASGWIGDFVSRNALTPNAIVERLSQYVDGIEGKLDFLAAFLDMYTDYYTHTGTQSLCRSLIQRAVNEI